MFFITFGIFCFLVAGFFFLRTQGLVRFAWGIVLGLSVVATGVAGWATFFAP